jgi:hypothetical protein
VARWCRRGAGSRARRWSLRQPAARGHRLRTWRGQGRRCSQSRWRAANCSYRYSLSRTDVRCAGVRRAARVDRAGAHVPEGIAGSGARSRRAPGSDGGTAAVGGDDRAGDVARLWERRGRRSLWRSLGAGRPGPAGSWHRGPRCVRERPRRSGPARQRWHCQIPEELNSAAQERVIAARVALARCRRRRGPGRSGRPCSRG